MELVINKQCFSTVPHLAKAGWRQYCHINSDPENIEQEDRAENLQALEISRYIKVVVVVVVVFLAKSHFR